MRLRRNYLLLTLLVMLLSVCSVQADDNIFGTKYYEGNRDMTWPVPDHYKLSGCFGDYRSHNAIDIPTGKNVPAVAAYGGTVKFTGWNGGYGNVVVIRHLYKLKNGKNIVLYTY
ncbi:MAG: M23 family metallopeptidase, partial [Blautia sp.]|nr:M23 family metallopeptidase [Blautia sp.]